MIATLLTQSLTLVPLVALLLVALLWKPVFRWLRHGLAVLAIAGIVWITWLLLWGNQVGGSRSDRWLDVVTGLGSLATIGGVLAGGYLAARYGRRASISITATPHVTSRGVVLSIRPVVKAVGVFPVRFRCGNGAVVRITEIWLAEEGPTHEGRFWVEGDIFRDSFAESGEELATTILSSTLPLAPSTIGWQVFVKIGAPTPKLLRALAPGLSAWWSDEVFVSRPSMTARDNLGSL